MSRVRYVIHLDPKAPVLLGTAQALGNYRASGSVIPGRTWRGALAAVLKRENHPLFDALFEQPADAQAHFGPLFPAAGSDLVGPHPPTWFKCKHKDHAPFDTLARQYAMEMVVEADPPPGVLDELRCPVCNAPAERHTKLDAEPGRASTTHVAINRVRRVAEDAQLYTREGITLDAGVYFTGWLDAPETLADDLAAALPVGRQMRIGANRSRGMGLVEIAKFGALETPSVEDRVRSFNDALRDAFRLYTRLGGPPPEGVYFTLDLRSEAILLQNGIPARDPDLSAYGIEAEIVRRWIAWSTVGGWHQVARLPRRTQAAVSGVYLYRCTGEPDFVALGALERAGVGLMREQGFGQLSICAPVHTRTGLDSMA